MNKTNHKTFMVNLRRLFKESGWNQTELARRSKISRPYLTNVINGKTRPGLRTVIRLSKAFGVEISDLLMPPQDKK